MTPRGILALLNSSGILGPVFLLPVGCYHPTVFFVPARSPDLAAVLPPVPPASSELRFPLSDPTE